MSTNALMLHAAVMDSITLCLPSPCTRCLVTSVTTCVYAGDPGGHVFVPTRNEAATDPQTGPE